MRKAARDDRNLHLFRDSVSGLNYLWVGLAGLTFPDSYRDLAAWRDLRHFEYFPRLVVVVRLSRCVERLSTHALVRIYGGKKIAAERWYRRIMLLKYAPNLSMNNSFFWRSTPLLKLVRRPGWRVLDFCF